MKRFISLLIASAMVVSLVPATAFAGDDVDATAKVVGSTTVTEPNGTADLYEETDGDLPELQITIADSSYTSNQDGEMEVEITLDEAEFSDDFQKAVNAAKDYESDGLKYTLKYDSDSNASGYDLPALAASGDTFDFIAITLDNAGDAEIDVSTIEIDDDELTFTITGQLDEDDKITIALNVVHELNSGDYATVSIDSDMVEADDITFITCADKGMEASIDDLTYIAEDEGATIEDIVIEEDVDGTFVEDQLLRLELSKGFEFGNDSDGGNLSGNGFTFIEDNDEYAFFTVTGAAVTNGEIEINGLYVYADDADEGDICEIEFTLYSTAASDDDDNEDGTSDEDNQYSKDKVADCEIEVAEVCEYAVTISVDDDDDVPVYYNGTDVDNTGLNDDGDHVSLEVTITESFPGAWSYRDEWELTLPEGVYVTAVDFDEENIDWASGTETESYGSESEYNFAMAYEEGGYEGFVFSKRIFDERDSDDDEIELTFTLELVAAPDFVGEVVLGFVGDSVTENEVVIAEFVSPYTVEASQNDVIIDYRNTPIDTPVIITEAEAELWSDEMIFYFSMESDYISFDSEGEVTVDGDSGMEVDVDTDDAAIEIAIDQESDDEAAVLTWDGIELYMSRTLAAGAYALDLDTSAAFAFMAEDIFAADEDDDIDIIAHVVDDTDYDADDDGGYSVEICENFVNIVTAGSDQAATFTTKVIVPVGEYYIYSGGTQIDLDVPAYISADGYTMLPVRAVATAIGVSTSNVLWDSATQQVTIIYGSKTIAMVIGQSYMTVNGTAIPTSACPEIVDGRTFLPLRDLATALSVTTINWDADTRTASLN